MTLVAESAAALIIGNELLSGKIQEANLFELARLLRTLGIALTRALIVPDDIEVIAYCNFPTPPPALVPVWRLGFAVSRVIERCVEVIDLQRRGETVPDVSLIPPQFEEELTS